MSQLQPRRVRLLALVAVLAVATAAAAQRFVWPPAAGDQMAQAPANQPPVNQPPADETMWTSPRTAPATAEEPLNLAARPATAVNNSTFPAFAVPAGGGQTQWQILENPNGPHAALIFDPVRQVFAVYHVDSASGQIMLKSVRNLSADLQLPQFNSSNPAPKDIQEMLDEAR